MSHHNRINGYFPEPEPDPRRKSSAGHPQGVFRPDAEPHRELPGHIVHVLTPAQAARLPEHPAAAIFSIKAADLKRLTRSIEQFGQQVPVVLYEDQVLDGRCRIRACFVLGATVQAIRLGTSDLNGLSPKQWVLQRNRAATDGRRMTDTEYALIVATVYGAEERERARQRQAGGVAVDGLLRGATHEVLASLFNLSPNLMKQALRLWRSGDPALLELVQNKQLSLSRAAELAGLPEADRQAALRQPRGSAGWTSPKQVQQALRRTVKSLESTAERLQQIQRSPHLPADTRGAIQPPLTNLRQALAALQEVVAAATPDAEA